VLAHVIPAELAATFPQLAAVECLLASEIGAPIDEPRLACIRARTSDRPDVGMLARELERRAAARIATAPKLWRELLDRRFRLFA
jgi:S-adenosylmethionine synthetase